MTKPQRFDHLVRLTDEHGLLEHSAGAQPRHDCGYCTDDNARLVVVAARHPDVEPLSALGRRALGFILNASTADGRMFNRFGRRGDGWGWLDRPSTGDWWGRAVGAFGTGAAEHPDAEFRDRARRGFERSAHLRSAWPHAMAFAMVGAADLLAVDPECNTARALLRDGLKQFDGTFQPWPEPRLTYANATLAEALIAAGTALEDRNAIAIGLDQLGWLRELQTRDGHLSFVGSHGREPNQRVMQFDQQPIEAVTLADAAYRAWIVTADRYWSETVLLCAAWFDGRNDLGCVMHDADTGGSYDGLTPAGPNTNQGAESTLALVATQQRADAVEAAMSGCDQFSDSLASR